MFNIYVCVKEYVIRMHDFQSSNLLQVLYHHCMQLFQMYLVDRFLLLSYLCWVLTGGVGQISEISTHGPSLRALPYPVKKKSVRFSFRVSVS
jgi:hypothetical protein